MHHAAYVWYLLTQANFKTSSATQHFPLFLLREHQYDTLNSHRNQQHFGSLAAMGCALLKDLSAI
jgi:hypothetical protein